MPLASRTPITPPERPVEGRNHLYKISVWKQTESQKLLNDLEYK